MPWIQVSAAQPHHAAPAGLGLEPREQLGAGEAAIGQHGDDAAISRQLVGQQQQCNHHLSADAGARMLKGLPEQRDGLVVIDHGEHHYAEGVPPHGGIKGEMQAVAWLLPVLDRPEQQRTIERVHLDAPIAEPTPAAALPTGGQVMAELQGSLPVTETDGLAEQQLGDHLAQQRKVPLVAGGAVLTEKGGQLSMEPGVGIHEGLVWCDNPKLSWPPAHLIP